MEIPKIVIDKLGKVNYLLTECFERTWGLLPKTPERDEIMLYILQAKAKLNQYIKENGGNE